MFIQLSTILNAEQNPNSAINIMRQKFILSQSYINKQDLFSLIHQLGVKHNYRIETSQLYNLDDIDLYKDVSSEDTYFIGFYIIDETEFDEDWFEYKGNQYAITILITHDSEMLGELNGIIREIMERYPELIVTSEMFSGFYSLEDIKNGNVAPWLEVE